MTKKRGRKDLKLETKKSKPVKVLHMTMLGAGGISTLTVNINKCIDLSKVTFDYLVFRNQKEFYENDILQLGEKKQIADVSNISNKLLKYYKKYSLTRSILLNEHYDVVHVDATTPLDIVVGIAAKHASVKTIIFHAHNSGEKNSFVKRICFNICKSIMPIVVTDYLSTSVQASIYMFNRGTIKKHDYTIVKNGIDASRYFYSDNIHLKMRNILSIEDEFVIGHVGRFSPQKNHFFMIQVLEHLIMYTNRVKMIFIGTGELEPEIKKKVSDLGLDQNVIFYGTTHDVPSLLSAMDAFLFPSLWEGLGIAGIEAQCSGLRTYCSKYIPEEANITDMFIRINSDNPEEWATRILSDFYDESRVRTDRIADVIKAGFDINTTAEKLQRVYVDSRERKR